MLSFRCRPQIRTHELHFHNVSQVIRQPLIVQAAINQALPFKTSIKINLLPRHSDLPHQSVNMWGMQSLRKGARGNNTI